MPFCQHCGFRNPNEDDDSCPVCKTEYFAAQTPAPAARKGPSTAAKVLDVTVRILVLVMLLLFFVHPAAQPYRDKFMDYMNTGLEHYQEQPPSSEVEFDRVMFVKAGDSEVEYSLKLNLPSNIYYTDENGRKVLIQQFEELKSTVPSGVHEDGMSDWRASKDVRDNKAYWNGTLDPGETDEIRVYYRFTAVAIEWDLSEANTGTLDDLNNTPEYERWVNQYCHDEYAIPYELGQSASWRIDPTHSDIYSLAYNITEKYNTGRNVYNILEGFYRYMREDAPHSGPDGTWKGLMYPTQDQMDYDARVHEGKPKPAVSTLADGYGDCDDQSIVFVSLCRAVGIPAWIESGALYDQVQQKWVNHGWAQIYVPLKGGGNATANVDVVNDQFLRRDANRFTDWIDSGVPGDMEIAYNNLHYFGSSAQFGDEYRVIRFTPQKSDISIKV